jgi:rfaE bifunctional protein nucleotidyltransferase chain/domain
MRPEHAAKVTDLAGATARRQLWSDEGHRVVFTNGVFDLLHRGHVEYLTEARSLGDRLIVGVNTDASARRLGKGEDRPINPLEDRLVVLAGLESVDLLVPFEPDTPLDLIRQLVPDILVKGGDYTEETVVGAPEVRARGGEVVIVPLRSGHSTTGLVERIRLTLSRRSS